MIGGNDGWGNEDKEKIQKQKALGGCEIKRMCHVSRGCVMRHVFLSMSNVQVRLFVLYSGVS